MCEFLGNMLRSLMHKIFNVDYAMLATNSYGSHIRRIYHIGDIWYVKYNDTRIELFADHKTTLGSITWAFVYHSKRRHTFSKIRQFEYPTSRRHYQYDDMMNSIANPEDSVLKAKLAVAEDMENISTIWMNIGKTINAMCSGNKADEAIKAPKHKAVKSAFKRPGFPLDPNDPQDLEEIYKIQKARNDKCNFNFLTGRQE